MGVVGGDEYNKWIDVVGRGRNDNSNVRNQENS